MRISRLGKRATSSVPAPISVAPSQVFDGNDGPWSTFHIQIGTPPQTVKVLISTHSSETLVVDPEGCTPSDPTNCPDSRGGFFQPDSSNTWSQNQDAADGLFPLTLGANLNSSGVGSYGSDSVSLSEQGGNGSKIDNVTVAGIATKSFYLGLLGLNPKDVSLPETPATYQSYMPKLNESNFVPSLSYGYTAGNQYRPGPVYGSLTLGGYDASRFEPNNISFPFNETDPRDLIVKIGSIFLITNDFYTILENPNQSITAAIDSTSPYIILPPDVCQQFEEAFGLVWDREVQAYLVNDTLHDALSTQNTSVTLNLGNSDTTPGQGINITLPYGAFDLTAEAPLLNTPGRYFPLRRAANDSQITLGRTFLQEAYVIADYERGNFSVSQCSWESGAQSHIVAIRRPGDDVSTDSEGSNGLSAGAIAGIVIGAIAAIIILIALGIELKKKYHRRVPKDPKPKHIDLGVTELDASGKDPYQFMTGEKNEPQSPELDGAEHKGHELDSSPNAESPSQGFTSPEPVYELDAGFRRSQAMTSPISFMSERSDTTRLHQRQQSDPISLASQSSDSTPGNERRVSRLSEPRSPMRERSDVARRLRREHSDAASPKLEVPTEKADDP